MNDKKDVGFSMNLKFLAKMTNKIKNELFDIENSDTTC